MIDARRGTVPYDMIKKSFKKTPRCCVREKKIWNDDAEALKINDAYPALVHIEERKNYIEMNKQKISDMMSEIKKMKDQKKNKKDENLIGKT